RAVTAADREGVATAAAALDEDVTAAVGAVIVEDLAVVGVEARGDVVGAAGDVDGLAARAADEGGRGGEEQLVGALGVELEDAEDLGDLGGRAEGGEDVAALVEQALEHREAGAAAGLVDGPAGEVADRARVAGDGAVGVDGAEEAADVAVVLDEGADVGLVGEPGVLE